jgi:hypothetical protein
MSTIKMAAIILPKRPSTKTPQPLAPLRAAAILSTEDGRGPVFFLIQQHFPSLCHPGREAAHLVSPGAGLSQSCRDFYDRRGWARR